MKFAAVAIAAIATFAATVNADACPPEETQKLLQLAFEPSLELCQEDSGFFFIPPSGTPTAEQVDKMCASEACPKTIAALSALNPSDCDLTFSNGVTLNVKKLIDELVPTCGFRRSRSLRQ